MYTLLIFIAGWFLGRYWDQVNAIVKDKLDKSKNSSGSVSRMNDD